MSLGMVNEVKIIDDYRLLLSPRNPMHRCSQPGPLLCPILSPKSHGAIQGPDRLIPWDRPLQVREMGEGRPDHLERHNDYWGEKAKAGQDYSKSIPEPRPGSWRSSPAPWTLPMIWTRTPSTFNQRGQACHHREAEHQCRHLAMNTEKTCAQDPASVRHHHAIDKAT